MLIKELLLLGENAWVKSLNKAEEKRTGKKFTNGWYDLLKFAKAGIEIGVEKNGSKFGVGNISSDKGSKATTPQLRKIRNLLASSVEDLKKMIQAVLNDKTLIEPAAASKAASTRSSKDERGDGFYLLSKKPMIGDEVPEDVSDGVSFHTYSGGGGDEHAFTDGDVKVLKTGIDTQAFRNEDEDDQESLKTMSKELSDELGTRVNLASLADDVASSCITYIKVKGGYLLIVATDD